MIPDTKRPQRDSIKKLLHKLRAIYLVLLTGTIAWDLALFAAPWFWRSGHPVWASGVYLIFSPICHQRPERSFFLWEHPLAACQRCTGIYLGFLVGVLIFPFITRSLRVTTKRVDPANIPNRWGLLAAMFLVAADVGSEFLGIRHTTLLSRFLTGAICGIVAPFYLLPQIFEFFSKVPQQSNAEVLQDAPEASHC